MDNTKKPRPLKHVTLVKTTIAFGVDENGTVCNKGIEIHIHPEKLEFRIPLPVYVAESVNNKSPYALGESAAEAIAEYEHLCDKYSRLRLLAGATPEPMLLITAFTPMSVARTLHVDEIMGSKHYLGVDYQPVFVLRSTEAAPRIFERNGLALGEEIMPNDGYSRAWSALIPDIREARDQLDAMVASTNLAASLLDGVFTAADPLVALMNVRMPAPQSVTGSFTTEPMSVDGVAALFGNEIASALVPATDPRQSVLPLVDGDPFNPLPTAAPAATTPAPAPFIDPDL